MSITRATILLLLSVLSPLSAQAAPELVLYNWSQYLATPLKQQFERETGYQIRELNYDSDEARNRLLLSEQPPNMDLVVVDYLTLRNPQIQQHFLSLQGLDLPQFNPSARARCGAYAVPYFWGSMGIAYRRDKVSRPLTSWHDLFAMQEELAGHLILVDDAVSLVSIALKELGYSLNTQTPAALQQAFRVLRQIRPSVLAYQYSLAALADPHIRDQIYATVIYGGDFYSLQQLSPHHDWVYVSPREGSLLWLDCLAIRNDSQHPDAAWQFLKLVTRVDMANINGELLGFIPPLHENLISKKITSNDVIYPNRQHLENSEYYISDDVGDRVRNTIYFSVLK